MIQKDKNMQGYVINGKSPIMKIGLPIAKGNVINEKDVTCVFGGKGSPLDYEVTSAKYFDHIDNEIIENYKFDGNSPVNVLVFEGNHPDIINFVKDYLSSRTDE
ncbi:hypothetical protein [Pedobacter helvus]|uniref:Uncharacterized protein n=1 Tax=Pedobacter helvus TaxID=2563444 RepID=A0ABW9JMG5_9SPHI|nr:hypothetical protein [Pedobacter ureilyticus]